MKTLLIPLLFLCLTIPGWAQNDIKNEIIAFTDSTELIIRNGRKLILEKVITGDHKAAISTLNYLKETVDEKYVILYPGEELLVSLASRNFELFLYDAENIESLLEGKSKSFQMESMSEEINQYLSTEMNFISEDLADSNLSPADKEFIQLYIRYYMNEDYQDLNKSVKVYRKTYPENKYSDFLTNMQQLTTTGRFNFGFGYGQEFLLGEIANAFSNHLNCLYVEMDGFINRLYLSFFVGGSVGNATSNFDMPIKKTDLIHEAGEKVSSMKYGCKIGHSVLNNHTINLYPYFSFGGYKMISESEVVDEDASEIKNKLTGSFYSGIGTSCDIAIKKWESKQPYDPEGLLFVRPSFGYDHFFTGKQYSKGGDFYFTFTLGISLGGM